MPLLTSLLVLIVVARLFGQLFQRFNQPAIVGEMLAGVLLGPSVFNFIQNSDALSGISELAVFLVVLSAGLEMNFKDIVNSLKGKGVVIAILGFVIPVAAGILTGMAFELDVMRTVFLGLCVSITALPVAVRILQSFGLLGTDIAHHSVATAIFNDILALLALGIILNLPEQRTIGAVGLSIVVISWKLLLLSGFILGFNWLLHKIEHWGVDIEGYTRRFVEWVGTEALFGILIVFVLIFSSVSESLGFHFVIGAFFGALLIDKKFFAAHHYKDVEHTLNSVSGGFLAPVFFATLGLEFHLGSISSFGFVAVVLLVSIASKMGAGWIGGRLIGISNVRSLGIGIILNGRGIMELVIASIAYERGFINQGLFSVLVLMGVVTTMITPLMMKQWVMPRLSKESL